jgi:CRISPR-associated endonuclease/helicase Cas3
MADLPSFDAFYRAVNAGQNPFPWQSRLAERVLRKGWPSEIGIPTGLGKTACIDIAVWSLAVQAVTRGPQREAPTRIWYVVNRRLLVDAAADRAERLGELLSEPTLVGKRWAGAADEDLAAVVTVADSLRKMTAFGSDPGPLHVVRLRAAAELGARVPDPSQPALMLATVPMFASRWLFRGYGSSVSMRPVDAALAGIDSLILLDEAHLARPLQRLADPDGPVALCDSGDPSLVLPNRRSRPVFVAMTATGQAADRFELDASDLVNETVYKRLYAVKRVAPVSCPPKDLAVTLANQAVANLEAQPGRASCLVFANSPRTARSIYDHLVLLLRARGVPSDLRLLTGRLREHEAEQVREFVLDLESGAPAGRPRSRAADLVVVATQTLEVGADLDFDCLVTQSAGARAVTQRLGRLNRLGERPDSIGVVIHPEGAEPSPVYGEEAARVWQRIHQAAQGGSVDLAPGRVATVVGEPEDEPQRVGELLPGHLWEWAKTSHSPPDEAPVDLFFEGFKERGVVSVIWRAHIPGPGVRLVPSVRESESVEIRISDLREALETRGLDSLHRLTKDRASIERVDDIRSLMPGDTVLLSPQAGFYDALGWNPSSREEVLDVSMLRSHILLLDDELIRNVVPGADADLLETLRSLRAEDAPEPLALDEEAVLAEQLRTQLGACEPHPWLSAAEWEGFLSGVSRVVARPIDDVPYLKPNATRRFEVELKAEAFEELSFVVSSSAGLQDHLNAVGGVALKMATRLGCSSQVTEAVARAGVLHDLGKCDSRFQRWLDPEAGAERALAKSRTPREQIESSRRAAGWPRGGRHELLSGRLVVAMYEGRDPAPEADLVLHLVLSHHGQGRPFVRVAADGSRGWVTATLDGLELRAPSDLSAPEWDQPARFRSLCERYGYWGLALLEAIVRQADHAASNIGGVV